MPYRRVLGRFAVAVSSTAEQDHTYGYGASLSVRRRADDADDEVKHDLSIEDLRELRHLLERAIINADEDRAQFLARMRRL